MSRTAPGFSEKNAGLKIAQMTAAPSIEPLVRTRSMATREIASFHGSGSTSRLVPRRFRWKWFLRERNGLRNCSIGAPINLKIRKKLPAFRRALLSKACSSWEDDLGREL